MIRIIKKTYTIQMSEDEAKAIHALLNSKIEMPVVEKWDEPLHEIRIAFNNEFSKPMKFADTGSINPFFCNDHDPHDR